MDEIIKRIDNYNQLNSYTLNLSLMGLKELNFKLPDYIATLNCSNNDLKSLPCNLPNFIKLLNCNNNKNLTK